jgi:hypothetical protein
MRSTRWITVIGLGLACGLGGCAFAVSNTESLLTQAGFRKLPADTPKRIEHMQTIAPHKLIKRTADGKSYYVFADPSNCKCLYVGNDAALARYKALVQREEDAMYLEEQRQEEDFQGMK